MYRVVLDPGVLIAALLSRTGAPAQILLSWIGGGFELVVSRKLLNELGAVLMRPKFRKYVTESEVRAYVTLFAHRASLVADPEPQPGVTPDPEDNYLIALGRVSGAHFLVSGDAHLTRLRLSQPPILTPRAFLTALLDTASPGGS